MKSFIYYTPITIKISLIDSKRVACKGIISRKLTSNVQGQIFAQIKAAGYRLQVK